MIPLVCVLHVAYYRLSAFVRCSPLCVRSHCYYCIGRLLYQKEFYRPAQKQ